MNVAGTAGLAVLTEVYLRYSKPGAISTVELHVDPFHDSDWWSVIPSVGTGFFGKKGKREKKAKNKRKGKKERRKTKEKEF